VTECEVSQFEAWLDTTRVNKLDGCEKGVLPAQEIITVTHATAEMNKVSCEQERRNYFNTKKIGGKRMPTGLLRYKYAREFIAEVDKSEKKGDAGAKCAVNMLHTWAKSDAFTVVEGMAGNKDPDYRRGAIDRAWLLNGIFNAYFKKPHVQQQAKALKIGRAINSWLHKLGRKVALDMEKNVAMGNNNRHFWMANAVLVAGLLNHDLKLIKESNAVFEVAMKEIVDDAIIPTERHGFLPLELKRLTKAHHYHHFATVPILSMAALSNAYGCDFAKTPWKRRQLVNLSGQALRGNLDGRESFFREINARFGDKGIRSRNDINEGEFESEIVQLAQGVGRNGLLDRINKFLQDHGGHRPYPPTRGKNSYDFRLGGKLQPLLERVQFLKSVEKNVLKSYCTNVDPVE